MQLQLVSFTLGYGVPTLRDYIVRICIKQVPCLAADILLLDYLHTDGDTSTWY